MDASVHLLKGRELTLQQYMADKQVHISTYNCCPEQNTQRLTKKPRKAPQTPGTNFCVSIDIVVRRLHIHTNLPMPQAHLLCLPSRPLNPLLHLLSTLSLQYKTTSLSTKVTHLGFPLLIILGVHPMRVEFAPLYRTQAPIARSRSDAHTTVCCLVAASPGPAGPQHS